jgi:hypothetical protein
VPMGVGIILLLCLTSSLCRPRERPLAPMARPSNLRARPTPFAHSSQHRKLVQNPIDHQPLPYRTAHNFCISSTPINRFHQTDRLR